MLQVWHVPVFYVDAASQRKCNFWQFLMQEPMWVIWAFMLFVQYLLHCCLPSTVCT
jgi:hypothetical protein